VNWQEVGGTDLPITAFQRERNSGSQETMESLVMKGFTMPPADQSIIGYGMGGPYLRLNDTPGGIGYTFYYYHFVQSPESPALLDPNYEPSMKVCKINGVMPSPATIGNHTYPFVTEVLAVVRKGTPRESSAARLRDWLLTPEGQALVKESGYVPITE
jgi:phosphate transport system substrate-binding protein